MNDFTNQQIDINQLPKLEEISYKAIESDYIKILYINYALLWGIPFLASLLTFYFIPEAYYMLFIAIFFALILIYTFAIIHKIFQTKGFAIRTHDIAKKGGYLFHKKTIVPFNRIQHISVEQSIIERWLKLATLKIFTAAGMQKTFRLAGITLADAEAMKQHILEQIKEENNTPVNYENL